MMIEASKKWGIDRGQRLLAKCYASASGARNYCGIEGKNALGVSVLVLALSKSHICMKFTCSMLCQFLSFSSLSKRTLFIGEPTWRWLAD